MTATVQDATGSLTPPPEIDINYGDELRWRAGYLLGSVDWVCVKLLGFSPLDKITEPLVGDWGRFQATGIAWKNISHATTIVGSNYSGMASDSSTFWEGDAAEAYAQQLNEISENFEGYAEACDVMTETTQAIEDVTEATAALLFEILSWLGSWASRIAAEAAIPIAGWAAGVIDGAINTGEAIRKCDKAFRAIEKVINVIKKMWDVVSFFLSRYGDFKQMVRAVNAGKGIATMYQAPGRTSSAVGAA